MWVVVGLGWGGRVDGDVLGGKCVRPRFLQRSATLVVYEELSLQEWRTWWRVNHEIIKIAPPHFRQKLPNHAILLRTTPHNAIPPVFQQEPDAHTSKSPFPIGIYGHPSI